MTSSLSSPAFHILVSLADRDRHGYAILTEVNQRTGGRLRLHAGTMYATIKRLLAEGLIQELPESPDPDNDDDRRRYYRITKSGRKAALREAEHFAGLVEQARAAGLALGRT